MAKSNEQHCGECKHLLCCQEWNHIRWKCTKGQNRRELALDGIHALRRPRCIREGWYVPRH
jgi:hypothetical protein